MQLVPSYSSNSMASGRDRTIHLSYHDGEISPRDTRGRHVAIAAHNAEYSASPVSLDPNREILHGGRRLHPLALPETVLPSVEHSPRKRLFSSQAVFSPRVSDVLHSAERPVQQYSMIKRVRQEEESTRAGHYGDAKVWQAPHMMPVRQRNAGSVATIGSSFPHRQSLSDDRNLSMQKLSAPTTFHATNEWLYPSAQREESLLIRPQTDMLSRPNAGSSTKSTRTIYIPTTERCSPATSRYRHSLGSQHISRVHEESTLPRTRQVFPERLVTLPVDERVQEPRREVLVRREYHPLAQTNLGEARFEESMVYVPHQSLHRDRPPLMYDREDVFLDGFRTTRRHPDDPPETRHLIPIAQER